ncbi:hypothetical protein BSKO_00373 [Bryopsis sp. KO-2023]|nr:hypothetical protein BSKO_00373 [Bryopsis sp. KO-2023]
MGDTRDVPHLLQLAQLNKLLSGNLNAEHGAPEESVRYAASAVVLEAETQSVLDAPDVLPGHSIRLLGRGGIPKEFIKETATAGTATGPSSQATSSETERHRNLWAPANQECRQDSGSMRDEASPLHYNDGMEISGLDTPQHTHSLRLLGNRPAFAFLHPHVQPDYLERIDDHRKTLSIHRERLEQMSNPRNPLSSMKPPEHVTSSATCLRDSRLQQGPSPGTGQLSSSCDPQQLLQSVRAFVGIPENAVVSFGDGDIILPPSEDENGALTKSSSMGSGQHHAENNQSRCGQECLNGPPMLADLTNVLDNAAEAVVGELRKIRDALERKTPPQTVIENNPCTTETPCHINKGTTSTEGCYNKGVAARLLTRLGHRTTLPQKDPPRKAIDRAKERSPTLRSVEKVHASASSETASAEGFEESVPTSPSEDFALPCPPIHMDPLPPSFLQERSKRPTELHIPAAISIPEPDQRHMRSFDDLQREHIQEKTAGEPKSPVESKASSQIMSGTPTSSHPAASSQDEASTDGQQVASQMLRSSRSVPESAVVEEKPGSVEEAFDSSSITYGGSENREVEVEKKSMASSPTTGNSQSTGSLVNDSASMSVAVEPLEKKGMSSEQVTSTLIAPRVSTAQGAAPETNESKVECCEPASPGQKLSMDGKPEQQDRSGENSIAMELAELIIKVTGSKEVPPATVARELGCSLEGHSKEKKSFLYVEDLTAFPGEIESNTNKETQAFMEDRHQATKVASCLKKDRGVVSEGSSSSSGRTSIDVDPGAFLSGRVEMRNKASRKDAGCQADCKDESVNRRASELSRICAKRASAARKAMRNAELNDLMKHIDEVRNLANEIEDDMVQTHSTMKSLEQQRREAYRDSLLKSKQRDRFRK